MIPSAEPVLSLPLSIQWAACQRSVNILHMVWAAVAQTGWRYISWKPMTSPNCLTYWRGLNSAAWLGRTMPKASFTTATHCRRAKPMVRESRSTKAVHHAKTVKKYVQEYISSVFLNRHRDHLQPQSKALLPCHWHQAVRRHSGGRVPWTSEVAKFCDGEYTVMVNHRRIAWVQVPSFYDVLVIHADCKVP